MIVLQCWCIFSGLYLSNYDMMVSLKCGRCLLFMNSMLVESYVKVAFHMLCYIAFIKWIDYDESQHMLMARLWVWVIYDKILVSGFQLIHVCFSLFSRCCYVCAMFHTIFLKYTKNYLLKFVNPTNELTLMPL